MEAWLLADKNCLLKYYGNGFKEDKLPHNRDIEAIDKDDFPPAFKQAASGCTDKKKGYEKGRDSFDILMLADANTIAKNCSWAKRFFDYLQKLMDDNS